MRSGWDRDALYMVINYGAWGGGHSHNDLLDFSMYAYGKPLALETTRWGSYDNPLNHYFRSPRAHNQVVVNDAPLDRVNHRGEDVEWVSGKEVDYFSARHRGYEKEFGVILERRIVFLKPRYFLISDTILETERHHAYTWYLHAPFRWKAGKRTSVAGGDPGLQVVPARPSEIRYVRQGVSYVESDGAPHPYPNRYWIGFQKWISSRNQFSIELRRCPGAIPKDPVTGGRRPGAGARKRAQSAVASGPWYPGGAEPPHGSDRLWNWGRRSGPVWRSQL